MIVQIFTQFYAPLKLKNNSGRNEALYKVRQRSGNYPRFVAFCLRENGTESSFARQFMRQFMEGETAKEKKFIGYLAR